MGFLALNTGGDAVGVFLQSVWWHSHYPSWKDLRGVPAIEIRGGCCRGVFAICVVALTILQLEGSKARSRD